jgi:hypothetical protein
LSRWYEFIINAIKARKWKTRQHCDIDEASMQEWATSRKASWFTDRTFKQLRVFNESFWSEFTNLFKAYEQQKLEDYIMSIYLKRTELWDTYELDDDYNYFDFDPTPKPGPTPGR